MFTGIIQALGSVENLQPRQGDIRLTVNVGKLDMQDVALGDSIAVNGVCLTVIEFDHSRFSADVSVETIRRTGFQNYQASQPVNLEKAMLPTSRMGGHIVSGHVDGIGTILSIQKLARAVEIWIEAPVELGKYLATKGSVTIDGTSLTVNEVKDNQFLLTLIPHTMQETIIQHYQPQTLVNIEVDVIARYVERLLQSKQTAESTSKIDTQFLAQHGYFK
jgi:riboflavin synthase